MVEDRIAAAESLVGLAQLWAQAGLAVAAVFLLWGIDRVEPNARGAYVFRPLLVPGVVLLWPLVLWRWAVSEGGRTDPLSRHRPPRGAHRAIWTVLAILLPLILIAALIMGQDGPAERPAVRLEAPA